MEDLRSGIEHLEQAKAHMSEANGIMNGHISKLKALEEENAELKAKLEAWIQPDGSHMKLPPDADDEPIRIGDEANIDGDAMTVLGYSAERTASCPERSASRWRGRRMTPETRQKAMRAIGFLEGFSAFVWAHACEEEKLAPEFAGAYDDCVEEVRKAVMSDGD